MELRQAFEIAYDPGNQPVALLQAAQHVLGEGIFQCDDIEASARRQAYGLCRDTLEAKMPEARCDDTDPWSAETFWELWKDDTGCRPRNCTWTGKTVRDWIALRSVRIFMEGM